MLDEDEVRLECWMSGQSHPCVRIICEFDQDPTNIAV